MSEQRKAIIIATGMDNTQLGKSIRTMVQEVKLAGEEIKRGFMPPSMTGDLVNYYRRAGKVAAKSFKEGQMEGGAGIGGLGKEALGFFGITLGLGAIDSFIEKGKAIENMAKITGLTTDNVQRINLAFKRTGVDVETADGALEKLNTKVGEARAGSDEAQQSFSKWGITIDGKKTNEIIAEIADKMHELPDPAERAALAMEMMGRTGKDLIPLLQQGAAAMEKMGSGPVMTKGMLEQAHNFEDAKENVKNWVPIITGFLTQWLVANPAKGFGYGYEKLFGSERTVDINEHINDDLNSPASVTKSQKKVTEELKAQRAIQEATDKNHKRFAEESAAAFKKADEDKKKSDKKSQDDQKAADDLHKETLKYEQRLRTQAEERLKVRDEMAHIDQASITLEQLAGRNYTERLNRAYGKGGEYDLESGNGPFAQIARDALLAQKQQSWDIIHGNAIFDKRGNLIGGEAFNDRKRQIWDENLLGGAGLQTPAMKMAEMSRHLDDINQNILDLLDTAKINGIVLKDPG